MLSNRLHPLEVLALLPTALLPLHPDPIMVDETSRRWTRCK